VSQAAAPHDTLVAVVAVVVGGAVVLFPSLALLFRLFLGGRLDYGEARAGARAARRTGAISNPSPALLARSAGACLVGGIGFLTVANSGWAHAVGVVSLLGFIVLGFFAAAPPGAAEGG
jgi:cytochrome d ubiquinol oxidase subunit II